MVTEHTLRILNGFGFGADTDALESYLINYKLCRNLSDVDKYSWNYEKLKDILSEVKPSSKLFSMEDPSEIIDAGINDKWFKRLGNHRTVRIYGDNDSDTLDKIINTSFNSEGQLLHLVAIPDVEGIDLEIIYEDGELKKIYAISESNKIFDFTTSFSSVNGVPRELTKINKVDTIEIRARAYLHKSSTIKNPLCDLFYCLRNQIHTSDISIIAYDIFFDGIEELGRGYLVKLSILSKIGFKAPAFALVKDVNRTNFKQVVETLDSHFDNSDNSLDYYHNGVIIRANNSDSNLLVYDTYNVNPNSIFKSYIVSYSTQGNRPYLKIAPIDVNKRLTISKIEIIDIWDLERYSLQINGIVSFRVIEGKAVIA